MYHPEKTGAQKSHSETATLGDRSVEISRRAELMTYLGLRSIEIVFDCIELNFGGSNLFVQCFCATDLPADIFGMWNYQCVQTILCIS